MDVVSRFEVWLCTLDPVVGSEMAKTRPVVIISPDPLHQNLSVAIVAPLSSQKKAYPTRVEVLFDGKPGQVVLEQVRTIDRRRLLKRLGALSPEEAQAVAGRLVGMFAY